MSAKNYVKAMKGEHGKGSTGTVSSKAAGAQNMKEMQEAALKDIQKRYEEDGQSAALKLAYLKYPMLGVTTFCCGCETDTLFIADTCCLCGGAMPKDSTVSSVSYREYNVKFVSDDGYTHFAQFRHTTKTEKQLTKDWEKSLAQAKKAGIDWSFSDAVSYMKDKGWQHEEVKTVQLDY